MITLSLSKSHDEALSPACGRQTQGEKGEKEIQGCSNLSKIQLKIKFFSLLLLPFCESSEKLLHADFWTFSLMKSLCRVGKWE